MVSFVNCNGHGAKDTIRRYMGTQQAERDRKRFGEWLYEHRVVLKINQAEAGRRAGISRTQWIRLEHGESGTKRENIPAIAKAIKADLHETYRKAGYAPPASERKHTSDFVARFYDLPESVQDDLVVQIDALWKKYSHEQKTAGK
jgi:transcriptional regulator with XRE-family HTH domain